MTEDDPVRGNEAFAYSHHKRLVEEMLAELRETHPELEQVVLRIGTILGERVDNQITALFQRPRLLKIRGSDSPFVFIWDTDVAAVIRQAVTGEVTGVFNVAGDGAMTVDDIAAALGKPVLSVPEPVIRAALAVGKRLGLTAYGPEQTMFLRYRPVLDNTRLKEVFGYVPSQDEQGGVRGLARRPRLTLPALETAPETRKPPGVGTGAFVREGQGWGTLCCVVGALPSRSDLSHCRPGGGLGPRQTCRSPYVVFTPRRGLQSSMTWTAASSAPAPAPSMPTSSATSSFSRSSWAPSSGATRRPARSRPARPPSSLPSICSTLSCAASS